MVDSQTVSLYKKLMWVFGGADLVFLGVLFVVSTDSFQGDHWLVSAIDDSTVLQSASSIFHGLSFSFESDDYGSFSCTSRFFNFLKRTISV
ncbi:hypothetical protein [Priestia megaterium]|uniref:hypothetical protein n=1 Tax=Priestia megaterium TaxID=1404 RepID=UPI001EDBC5E9|nr:hypothetical protein [Priestia megaterium]